METLDSESPYDGLRAETRGVPTGMEAFGPELVAEPLGNDPGEQPLDEPRAAELWAAIERLL